MSKRRRRWETLYSKWLYDDGREIYFHAYVATSIDDGVILHRRWIDTPDDKRRDMATWHEDINKATNKATLSYREWMIEAKGEVVE